MDFQEIFFKIKLFSAVFSFIFGGLAVYFIVKFQQLVGIKIQAAKLALRIPEVAYGGAAQSKWEEICRHMDSPKESSWKLAIIEADNLVDNLLKSAGYQGDTMGDRLTNIERGQLPGLDGLWEAHKVRNKLVHDMNYFLRYAEAKKTIQFYENVLKELGGV